MAYQDKVVIVTGGSRGIGEGCVRVFAAAGAKVVFCARSETESAALVAELKSSKPGQVDFIKCDVSRTDEIEALVQSTIALHGRLDCLVNNAGWHPPHKPIDDFSVENFQELLNLNLVCAFDEIYLT